jgi:hypothetical protein
MEASTPAPGAAIPAQAYHGDPAVLQLSGAVPRQRLGRRIREAERVEDLVGSLRADALPAEMRVCAQNLRPSAPAAAGPEGS